MTFVFVDVETTGLDPEKHQVWEIAYATDSGPVKSSFVKHTLDGANPESLVISQYRERHHFGGYDAVFEAEMQGALEGATLVGSNPRFDAAFLKARWGNEPWHYRLLDVCAYVAGARGLDYVPGLSDAAEIMGVELQPDHTAETDVLVAQGVYYAAREYVRKWEK